MGKPSTRQRQPNGRISSTSIGRNRSLSKLDTLFAMTARDREVERFDRWADTYDRSFLQRRVFEPVHEALIEALGPVEGRRVLDVGCGTGTLTIALARRSARAIGVDPAPRMVAQARAKRGEAPVSFLVASAESLPFDDASFERATASLTVHHWADAERGLAELARVLRPGGRAAIAEIDLPSPIRWVLRLVGSPHAGWSRRELAGILHRSGFSRVETMARGPLGPKLAIIRADR
jgi:ubiquinone/menaquinone biosynthesis C-methylase UbiE